MSENFEEFIIESVRLDRDANEWVCNLEHDFTVSIKRGGPVQPRKGQTMKVFGNVERFPSGIEVDGKTVHKRSPEEQAVFVAEQETIELAEWKAHYREISSTLDTRYAELLPTLKGHIDAARESFNRGDEAFDVLQLERYIEVCEYATAFELMVFDEPSLETLFLIELMSTLRETCGDLADQTMEVSRRVATTRGKKDRALWIEKFFHERLFDMPPQMVRDVKELAHTLMQGRSDVRLEEIERWKMGLEELAMTRPHAMTQEDAAAMQNPPPKPEVQLPAEVENQLKEEE